MSLIDTVLSPVLEVINKLVPDSDLKTKLQAELSSKLIDLQSLETQKASDVVIAEAKGESWLQRNWRPISMLFFLVLIGSYWFGLAPVYISSNPDVVTKLFGVFQIGLGGYVVGRSVEKTATTLAPAITAALKKPAVPKT